MRAHAHDEADVAGVQRAANIRQGRQPAGEGADGFEAEFLNELAQGFHFGAVADEEVAQLGDFRADVGQGAENPIVAFVGVQDAVVDEDDVIRGKAE